MSGYTKEEVIKLTDLGYPTNTVSSRGSTAPTGWPALERHLHRNLSFQDAWDEGQWEDHYRRCFSKDTIEVSPELAKLVPSSMSDKVGYVFKEGDPPKTIFTEAERLQLKIDRALEVCDSAGEGNVDAAILLRAVAGILKAET